MSAVRAARACRPGASPQPVRVLGMAASALPVTTSPDVMERVLSMLPVDERARAACVCPVWRDVARVLLCGSGVGPTRRWADLDFTARGGCTAVVNDAVLALLCARAGANLRVLRLDSSARDYFTAGGVVRALQAGGCCDVRDVGLTGLPADGLATAEQALQLAAACPRLTRAAVGVLCPSFADVRGVVSKLPGPLELSFEEDAIDEADAADVAALSAGTVSALSLYMTQETADEGGFRLDLSPEFTKALADALKDHPSLQKLDFARLRFAGGAQSAAQLAAALATCNQLQSLKLMLRHMDAEHATALATTLRQHSTLQSLEVSGAAGDEDLNDEIDTEALCVALSGNTTLTALNLRGSSAHGSAAALVHALQAGMPLRLLDLADTFIVEGDDAIALARALARISTLTCLDLSGNHIGAAGAAELASALRGLTALQSLDVSRCQMEPADVGAVCNALAGSATLMDLNIGGNTFGAEGGAALGKLLARCPSLQTLTMLGFGVDEAAAVRIARGLARNKSLQNLVVSCGTFFAAEDGLPFCAALASHPALRSLSFRSDGRARPLAGATSLAVVLRQSTSLQCLDLPKLPTEGVALIAAALRDNRTLLTLSLSGADDDGANHIAASLRGHPSLRELGVSLGTIGNAGAAALALASRSARKLVSLNLLGNAIGPLGAGAVADALRAGRQPHAAAAGAEATCALLHLNLDMNPIGTVGAQALSEGVRDAPVALRRLEVGAACGISEDGLEILQTSSELRGTTLGFNPFS